MHYYVDEVEVAQRIILAFVEWLFDDEIPTLCACRLVYSSKQGQRGVATV